MRLSRCALIVLALWLFAHPAVASELYSLDSQFLNNSSIYRLNQLNGAEALVGPVGAAFAFPGDLTSDTNPGTFRIWSCDINNNNLLKIDPLTGAGSVIGTFMTPAGGPVRMVSLAFDPVTSTLYGNTSFAYGGSPDHLFRIDPNTALSVPIGAGIGFNDVFALGFSQTGKLYGISNAAHQLLLIDTLLGSGAVVGPVVPTAVFDLATRPEDGAAFVVDSGTLGTNSLYRLDLNTGGTGLIGAHANVHNMVGLAFGPVPEPGTLTLLAIGAGVALFRRRRLT